MSKKKRTEGLVFDDDTSDTEDEELQSFRKNFQKVSGVKKGKISAAGQSSDSENDELEDDGETGSDDEEGSDDDNEDDNLSDDDEMENSDEDEIENNINCVERKDDKQIKERLCQLGSLLKKSRKKDIRSSDEDDDVSDDDKSDGTSDDNSEHEKISDEQESENEEQNLQTLSKNSKQSQSSSKDRKSLKRPMEEGAVETKKKDTILSEEEERARYKTTLSKLSVEEILAIKSSLGTKVFNNKWSGQQKNKDKKIIPEFKRDNKNRPREISSKVRVPKFQRVVPVSKEEKRDPRFDPLCGEFDKNEFRKSYKFLNKVKEQELSVLKTQLKGAHGEERENLKYLIQRTENQLRSEKERTEKEREAALERREQKTQLDRGEKPVFKSSKKRREEEIVRTYETLKEKGNIDNYIRKRNKKNTAKDRKMLGKSYND